MCSKFDGHFCDESGLYSKTAGIFLIKKNLSFLGKNNILTRNDK